MGSPGFWELAVGVSPDLSEGLTNLVWELGALGVVEEERPGRGARLRAFFPATASATWSRGECPGIPRRAARARLRARHRSERRRAGRRELGGRLARALHAALRRAPASDRSAVGHARAERPDRHHDRSGARVRDGSPRQHPRMPRGARVGVDRDRPPRMIDLGTGSGILAIAAARLGVRAILAVDDDPDAVAAAVANVARNHVADRVRCVLADAGRLAETAPAPLVVANLLSARSSPARGAVRAHAGAGRRRCSSAASSTARRPTSSGHSVITASIPASRSPWRAGPRWSFVRRFTITPERIAGGRDRLRPRRVTPPLARPPAPLRGHGARRRRRRARIHRAPRDGRRAGDGHRARARRPRGRVARPDHARAVGPQGRQDGVDRARRHRAGRGGSRPGVDGAHRDQARARPLARARAALAARRVGGGEAMRPRRGPRPSRRRDRSPTFSRATSPPICGSASGKARRRPSDRARLRPLDRRSRRACRPRCRGARAFAS